MTRLDSRLQPLRSGRRPAAPGEARVSVEIHVGAGFDAQEAASIARTLAEANHLLQERHFGWRYVSDNPGLLEARCGLMVRAEPAIDNHGLGDFVNSPSPLQISFEVFFLRFKALRHQLYINYKNVLKLSIQKCLEWLI